MTILFIEIGDQLESVISKIPDESTEYVDLSNLPGELETTTSMTDTTCNTLSIPLDDVDAVVARTIGLSPRDKHLSSAF